MAGEPAVNRHQRYVATLVASFFVGVLVGQVIVRVWPS